jgi:hypothetical protein
MWSLKAFLSLAVPFVSVWSAATQPARPALDAPVPPPDTLRVGAFRFGTAAGEQLTRLWAESIDARAERVACIGGVRRDGISLVTRVRELRADGADVANIPASNSLDECRPPQWFGTVHTHIATFQGLRYTTFSAPDRDVMDRWNRRWQEDGVFCVLYSETEAHCEVGRDISEDMTYAAVTIPRLVLQRGNIIGATH